MFDLNKYEVQKQLYNEPSLEDLDESFTYGPKYLYFGYLKNACDNLDDIINND
jgi:hypothetical protein